MKAVLTLLLVLTLSAAGIAQREEDRPNFLIILVDDLGPEQLACYGSKENSTPNIDRLAREGTLFRTAYATPICTPSRALLMSGRYGYQTGWLNFTGRKGSPTATDPNYNFGRAERTFAHVLRDNGYHTGLAGRWLSVGNEHVQIPDAGFTEYQVWGIWGQKLPPGVKHTGEWERKDRVTSRFWHPCIIRDGQYVETRENDYGPDLMLTYCKDFLRRHRDDSFLLFYPMILVHDPYPPVPDLKNPGQRKTGNLKNFVEYTDYITGELMLTIDDLGLRENTIVIFAGDNGTVKAGKGTPTEMGARVPLIVRSPGRVKGGMVSEELTDFSDVFPTLLDFAGIPLPGDFSLDGKSLVSTLVSGQEHRPWIYSYFIDGQVLRDKRWLYQEGRFFDCGSNRDGVGYVDVTESVDPEVLEMKNRFGRLLEKFAAKESQLQ